MEHLGVHKLCTVVLVECLSFPPMRLVQASQVWLFLCTPFVPQFPFLQGQNPALAVGTLQLSPPGQAGSAIVAMGLLSGLAAASFPLWVPLQQPLGHRQEAGEAPGPGQARLMFGIPVFLVAQEQP